MTPFQEREFLNPVNPHRETRRKRNIRLVRESIDKINSPRVSLSEEQREKLVRIWFVYGNRGIKTTRANHKWIQTFLERGLDMSPWFDMTEECFERVMSVVYPDGQRPEYNKIYKERDET